MFVLGAVYTPQYQKISQFVRRSTICSTIVKKSLFRTVGKDNSRYIKAL